MWFPSLVQLTLQALTVPPHVRFNRLLPDILPHDDLLCAAVGLKNILLLSGQSTLLASSVTLSRPCKYRQRELELTS